MLAYISAKADNRIIDALAREGFEVKLLAPFSALSEPTDTHADMLMLVAGNVIFTHADYQVDFPDSYKIVKISEQLGDKYPHDVLFNIAIVGKHVFCNKKHASSEILDYLVGHGYSIHHVAQGYAHCSTCIVGNNAIITADEGIFALASSIGIDALQISAGHISLPPYNYGFIGGASGTTENAVYFCGSLKCHPEGEAISTFIKSHGKRVVELCDSPLSDVGGIVFA